MGDPLDEGTRIGPLIDAAAVEKVRAHVEDAAARGAKVLLGGKRRTDGALGKGYFFEPTILGDVTHEMLVMREETFGPVAPIMAFDGREQALDGVGPTRCRRAWRRLFTRVGRRHRRRRCRAAAGSSRDPLGSTEKPLPGRCTRVRRGQAVGPRQGAGRRGLRSFSTPN